MLLSSRWKLVRLPTAFDLSRILPGGSSVGLEMLYIEPDSPGQNGVAESFFSRLREELLNVEEFENLAEARWFAARRGKKRNAERPHVRLGYRIPAAVRRFRYGDTLRTP